MLALPVDEPYFPETLITESPLNGLPETLPSSTPSPPVSHAPQMLGLRSTS